MAACESEMLFYKPTDIAMRRVCVCVKPISGLAIDYIVGHLRIELYKINMNDEYEFYNRLCNIYYNYMLGVELKDGKERFCL